MGRSLGLDVGTKTIGVAVSDAIGLLAHPVCTVARQGVRKDVVQLAAIAVDKQVDTVIVGLPLELDGTEERSARLARQIGAAMHQSTGLDVLYIDERYSSVDAERQLIQARVGRERRKEVIDQQAAVLILQAWLESGDGAVVDKEGANGGAE